MRQIAPKVDIDARIASVTPKEMAVAWNLSELPDEVWDALGALEKVADALGADAPDASGKITEWGCHNTLIGISQGFFDTNVELCPTGIRLWNPIFWENSGSGIEKLCPEPIVVPWESVLDQYVLGTDLDFPEEATADDNSAESARATAAAMRAIADQLDAMAARVEEQIARDAS